ncbi:MAG: SH3 domain-containing protein [Candidatus Thorarchaeota archaeon]
MKIVKVIKNHKSEFNIPLIAKRGEKIEGQERETEWEGWLWCRNSSGLQGWVPKKYLEATSQSGQFQFLQDYNARELTIDEGQEVIVINEESGWAWVRTTLGEEGWIPLKNLQDLAAKPNSIPDLME